jgi:hypothetical protein
MDSSNKVNKLHNEIFLDVGAANLTRISFIIEHQQMRKEVIIENRKELDEI